MQRKDGFYVDLQFLLKAPKRGTCVSLSLASSNRYLGMRRFPTNRWCDPLHHGLKETKEYLQDSNTKHPPAASSPPRNRLLFAPKSAKNIFLPPALSPCPESCAPPSPSSGNRLMIRAKPKGNQGNRLRTQSKIIQDWVMSKPPNANFGLSYQY